MDESLDDLRSERSRAITLRTRICIWVIAVGLANFLGYAVAYTVIDGEAVHGYVRTVTTPDGKVVREYYLWDSMRTSPTPEPDSRAYKFRRTSRGVWIYSAIHSTSIWITVGAVLLAMLTLAKDRIVSSMRSTIIRGRTFITIVATLVTVICVWLTIRFTLVLIRQVTGS